MEKTQKDDWMTMIEDRGGDIKNQEHATIDAYMRYYLGMDIDEYDPDIWCDLIDGMLSSIQTDPHQRHPIADAIMVVWYETSEIAHDLLPHMARYEDPRLAYDVLRNIGMDADEYDYSDF